MGKNSSKHLWETGNSVNITNRSSLAEREVIANTAEESLVLLGEGIHGGWGAVGSSHPSLVHIQYLNFPHRSLEQSHMCKCWGKKGPMGAFHQLGLKDGPSSRHLGAQGTLS